MNSLVKTDERSTLVQKLKVLSLPVSELKNSSPIRKQALQLRESMQGELSAVQLSYKDEHGKVYAMNYVKTPFFDTYDVEAEFTLSQPDISLGAIINLPFMENPTLRIYTEAFGESSAIAWLYKHISILNASSGVSRVMDEQGLIMCAKDIIHNYWWMNLGEFCVFCSRFRAHHYVQKRSDYIFSSDTIMQGLKEYLPDRRKADTLWDRQHNGKTWDELVASNDEIKKLVQPKENLLAAKFEFK